MVTGHFLYTGFCLRVNDEQTFHTLLMESNMLVGMQWETILNVLIYQIARSIYMRLAAIFCVKSTSD